MENDTHVADGSGPLPGVLRWPIGDLTVTVLNDGGGQGSLDLVTGISGDEARALQLAGFRSEEPKLTVNGFLVTAPGRTPLLIDTGYGTRGPETAGRLCSALRAAGVGPETIGTVLLSHLHPDHAGGLLTEAGTATYPNAELVLHADEARHWLPDEALSKAPVGARPYVETARAAVAAYGGRVRQHEGGEVAGGISAVPLPGHTPGHCGFRITSGAASLLMWTDIVHLPAMQFARPEAGVVFDVDGEQARTTRRRILDEVATERCLIAGSHLEFPALGYVAREGAGYRFVPELWVAAQV